MKRTDKRLSKIRARLDEGYSPDDLCRAVDGCLSNPHNVENGYVDIELICRDQPHVEQYMAWQRKGSSAGNGSDLARMTTTEFLEQEARLEQEETERGYGTIAAHSPESPRHTRGPEGVGDSQSPASAR